MPRTASIGSNTNREYYVRTRNYPPAEALASFIVIGDSLITGSRPGQDSLD